MPSGEDAAQRLFFALWPDDDLRQELARIGRQYAHERDRLAHPEDLHVTLVFLGPVEPERVDCVMQAAESVRSEPFELQIDQLNYWFRPRILWCGPTQTPEPALALFRNLQAALEPCGFKPERRPFKPHVTLARKARYKRSQNLEKPLLWKISEFVLVRSQPGGLPPFYDVVKRWPLGS